MTRQAGDPWYVEGRASAMAELFFQKLGANLFQKEPPYRAVDYQISFTRPGGKGRRVLNVEVKGTSHVDANFWPLIANQRFLEMAHRDDELFLLLVADIVNEKLFYIWGTDIRATGAEANLEGRSRLKLKLRPVNADTARTIRDRILR